MINLCAVRKQKQVKPIGLNYFIGQTKKVTYVFHRNWDSFNMIFITIIQPKIHKGNKPLKLRIRFYRVLYFHLWDSRTMPTLGSDDLTNF